jgi:photosystem II stability/assembly factor-like uncharacterized protein
VSGLSGEAPIPAVRFHVDDGRLLYAYVAGAAMELRRSHDAGTSWEAIPAPVARVVAVAVGPAQHVGLATADSNVIRSADGGRSWQTILARGRPVRR